MPVKARDPVVVPDPSPVAPSVPLDPDEEPPDVPLAPEVVLVPLAAVVEVVPPEEVVAAVVDAVVVVGDEVVVGVEVEERPPGTADHTKPFGSVELAVKVIWVFQLSVRALEELAQAMPVSHSPLPARRVARGILAAATAGPHSKFNGRVVTSPVVGAVLNGP
jgi:hypothetical protein